MAGGVQWQQQGMVVLCVWGGGREGTSSSRCQQQHSPRCVSCLGLCTQVGDRAGCCCACMGLQACKQSTWPAEATLVPVQAAQRCGWSWLRPHTGKLKLHEYRCYALWQQLWLT